MTESGCRLKFASILEWTTSRRDWLKQKGHRHVLGLLAEQLPGGRVLQDLVHSDRMGLDPRPEDVMNVCVGRSRLQ